VTDKRPTSGRAAKAITGCGGCGCLTGLVALIAGGIMLAWGSTDSKVTELVAPGAAVLVLAIAIGFFASAVLIGGVVAMTRARRSAEVAAVAPAPVAPVDTQPAFTPTPPGPPGAPPMGPPPEW
jgi:hypothetical protein